MDFTIKNPPMVSTNAFYSGMHWNDRREIAKVYKGMTHEALGRVGMLEGGPFTIMFRVYKNRPYDASNCTVMGKMIEDALKGKIIPDDGVKQVKCVSFMSFTCSKQEQRIEVEVKLF